MKVPRVLPHIIGSLFLMFSSQVFAHAMAPGLLTLTEIDPDGSANAGSKERYTRFEVTWKLPLKQVGNQRPTPRLPDDCKALARGVERVEGTGKVVEWQIGCDREITGQILAVDGLKSGQSGVLVRVNLVDGRQFHQMLSAEQPEYSVPEKKNRFQIAINYLTLGVEHLFAGIDHILFVLMLFLLVGWNRQLFWTITLFTVGHSLTLALATLQIVSFPARLTEAFIALSIVVTACEWLRNSPNTLFKRFPWLVSLLFGLLHGMGFAGVLSDIGLPQQEIPLALAAFNIGIEIGQLVVVALAAMALWLLLRVRQEWSSRSETLGRFAVGYSVGIWAAMWFWQRLLF